MVSYLPPQPQNETITENFSDAVKRHMKQKGFSQSDMVRQSALSKTTISRICRNSNDKGSSYLPTHNVVMALSIGLKLSSEEGWLLLFTAFPELGLMGKMLNERLDIDQANYLLDDLGLPLLGNMAE